MTTTARSETFFLLTLPGRYYYDPAIYEREQERIFASMWVCVGRAEALAGAGAYRTVLIGRESIIVVRNRDGSLQAFFNVCRHRGARLCTQAVGHLKGSIQCRYHAWTYGLDGRLIGAPNVLNMDDFDRAAFGLLPVALEVWEGLIWLNMADAPTPIADQVDGPIVEQLAWAHRPCSTRSALPRPPELPAAVQTLRGRNHPYSAHWAPRSACHQAHKSRRDSGIGSTPSNVPQPGCTGERPGAGKH